MECNKQHANRYVYNIKRRDNAKSHCCIKDVATKHLHITIILSKGGFYHEKFYQGGYSTQLSHAVPLQLIKEFKDGRCYEAYKHFSSEHDCGVERREAVVNGLR